MTLSSNSRRVAAVSALVPGLALAGVVAAAGLAAEPLVAGLTGGRTILPAIVIALLLGMMLSGAAASPVFSAGLDFAVKTVLRWAIALLGLRIALSDIVALGPAIVMLIVAAMVSTIVASVWLSERAGLGRGYGVMAGAATAVCGASAALATASIVPPYPQKKADIAFTVTAANGVSTLVMLAYPWLARTLDLSPGESAVLIGATIHDMAQVVGAGYAMSDPVGNGAVVVKLFRVFLLLPVVVVIGWWLASTSVSEGPNLSRAQVPVPIFAFVFLLFATVNSILPQADALAAPYAIAKPWLMLASSAGLLLAIAALGLGTSLKALAEIGWRHGLVFTVATIVILLVTLIGLALIRSFSVP